jgi:hypothetical protein
MSTQRERSRALYEGADGGRPGERRTSVRQAEHKAVESGSRWCFFNYTKYKFCIKKGIKNEEKGQKMTATWDRILDYSKTINQ